MTGVVLAGGAGRRLGGRDKALEPFRGRPLIHHVLERLRPQVGTILISANRNHDLHERTGYRVIGDLTPGVPGPLAGLEAALTATATPWLVTVPCDTPFLPLHLVATLIGTDPEPPPVTVAHDGQRLQPAFALLHRNLLADLSACLAAGERKLGAWLTRHPWRAARMTEDPRSFVNLNTPGDWTPWEEP
ncbi:MAG: molybdenum cofactor guanylyltransferase [Magnetococcales bacterium]|nr:molybdenum cofactor guanylyltransferase [Magnetococcales bacterium]